MLGEIGLLVYECACDGERCPLMRHSGTYLHLPVIALCRNGQLMATIRYPMLAQCSVSLQSAQAVCSTYLVQMHNFLI